MRLVMAYITARDRKQALSIGGSLVKERLAACANVLHGVDSVYRWKGRLCRDREAVLIVKTRAALLNRLVKRVLQLHSYEIPCVVAWPIAGGNREFLAWAGKETARGNLSERPARKK